jgi:hypothetical protein
MIRKLSGVGAPISQILLLRSRSFVVVSAKGVEAEYRIEKASWIMVTCDIGPCSLWQAERRAQTSFMEMQSSIREASEGAHFDWIYAWMDMSLSDQFS